MLGDLRADREPSLDLSLDVDQHLVVLLRGESLGAGQSTRCGRLQGGHVEQPEGLVHVLSGSERLKTHLGLRLRDADDGLQLPVRVERGDSGQLQCQYRGRQGSKKICRGQQRLTEGSAVIRSREMTITDPKPAKDGKCQRVLATSPFDQPLELIRPEITAHILLSDVRQRQDLFETSEHTTSHANPHHSRSSSVSPRHTDEHTDRQTVCGPHLTVMGMARRFSD